MTGSDGREGPAVESRARTLGRPSGVDEDSGRPVGVAVYDHPGNLRHPTHWKCFAQEGFGFVNPAFVLAEPYTLEPDDTLHCATASSSIPGWATGGARGEAQRFAATA